MMNFLALRGLTPEVNEERYSQASVLELGQR
jgi:hypothetical protein